MISCILLSAGSSSRFGFPKALARLNDEPIILRLQNQLLLSRVAEIIIVLGAHEKEIKSSLLKHERIRAVYNKDHILGQTSSFQAGVRASSDSVTGYMLLPVDYPLVRRETIDKLISCFEGSSFEIVIPTYESIKGHPPIFSVSLKEEILKLQANCGLNQLERQHKEKTSLLPVDDKGTLRTFNTREEFEKLINS